MPTSTNTSILTEYKLNMMQVAQLTYRLFEERDIPGILSLWESSSGWGSITEQQFDEWYIHTPFGRSLIIVATNELDEIAGQIAFIPATIFLDGKELKALRLSAPILHENFRLTDLRNPRHPAFSMVKRGIELGVKMGYHVLYSLPAHGWIGFMKLMPKFGMPDGYTAEYDCVAISLNDESGYEEESGNHLIVYTTDSFNESYDQLWADAIQMFPVSCGVVRSSSQLQWKISHHLVFEVREDERLLGYAAYKKTDGLLVDMLARNPGDLKRVFFASVRAMHLKNPNHEVISFEEIKLMLSPQIKSLIAGIKYQPVKFQFAFGCCPLQLSVDQNSIHPEKWYIMPND